MPALPESAPFQPVTALLAQCEHTRGEVPLQVLGEEQDGCLLASVVAVPTRRRPRRPSDDLA